MSLVQIIAHPRNQVIFEDTFNQLVQKVGSKKLMNIRTRKSMCKRLIRIEEINFISTGDRLGVKSY